MVIIFMLLVLLGTASFAADSDAVLDPSLKVQDFSIPTRWNCVDVREAKRKFLRANNIWRANNMEAYGLKECLLEQGVLQEKLTLRNASETLAISFERLANIVEPGVIFSMSEYPENNPSDFLTGGIKSDGDGTCRIVMPNLEEYRRVLQGYFFGRSVRPLSVGWYDFGEERLNVGRFLSYDHFERGYDFLRITVEYKDFRKIAVSHGMLVDDCIIESTHMHFAEFCYEFCALV